MSYQINVIGHTTDQAEFDRIVNEARAFAQAVDGVESAALTGTDHGGQEVSIDLLAEPEEPSAPSTPPAES